MNGVFVTVSGVVGSDPKRGAWNGQAVLSFRMVSNERKWDAATRTWIDVHSSWMQVSCFGTLAHHVDASIRKGDRILVHGKLRVNDYQAPDGERRTGVDVVADSLGPDLMFGEARLRPRRRTDDAEEQLRQHAEELGRELDQEPRLTVAQLIALRADQRDDEDWESDGAHEEADEADEADDEDDDEEGEEEAGEDALDVRGTEADGPSDAPQLASAGR